MRTLSATLTANQKSLARPPLLKLVLTKSGESTQTYDISSSTNRIIGSTHLEQEWAQVASFAIDSDSTLAGLSLQGYTGTISYGYNDATNGDEYSACAPLEVVAQNSRTILNKPNSQLVTQFSLVGVFDMMRAEKASVKYTQDSTDTQTVKDLLTAIAGATLTPFTNCKAYTITFDSEDSIIDSYIPAEYFTVSVGESRLSVFQRLIGLTACKARIEDDGEIHVFNPTISGASYDYQYNDAVTNHNFFQKGTNKRLVIPNKIVVSSHPDAGSYTGSASDGSTYNALGRFITDYKYIKATSNSQCDDVATAILQHLQVGAEKGSGLAPMNCGQEVMDYVLITDSIASDTRAGNIGYLRRRYIPGIDFNFSFGFGTLAGGMGFLTPLGGDGVPGWDVYYELLDYVNSIASQVLTNTADILALRNNENFDAVIPRLHVTEHLKIPVGTDKYR